MKEIGSEFMTNSTRVGNNKYEFLNNYPKKFVLSGRTGLHLISQEIKDKINVLSIALPSYCCGSMISPFIKQGFKISFYDPFDFEKMMLNDNVQVVLIMDYFGFVTNQTFEFALKCKQNGKTIIVDATQTSFSKSKTYDLADYIIVSCRKWTDCLGAIVYSKHGFVSDNSSKAQVSYNSTWRKAADLKCRYIQRGTGDKKEFLSMYVSANHILDEDYSGYRMEPEEVDIWKTADSDYLRKKRRDNAAFLMEQIEKMSFYHKIKLMFEDMGDEDCPMFVPILLDSGKRGFVRGELIKNSIYCPVHWPIDERYPHQKTIYHEQELSLICDQRYGLDEMKKQANALLYALTLLEK